MASAVLNATTLNKFCPSPHPALSVIDLALHLTCSYSCRYCTAPHAVTVPLAHWCQLSRIPRPGPINATIAGQPNHLYIFRYICMLVSV